MAPYSHSTLFNVIKNDTNRQPVCDSRGLSTGIVFDDIE